MYVGLTKQAPPKMDKAGELVNVSLQLQQEQNASNSSKIKRQQHFSEEVIEQSLTVHSSTPDIEKKETELKPKRFMPDSGRNISEIAFPDFSFLHSIEADEIDRINLFRSKARLKKQIGQAFYVAAGNHNGYLVKQNSPPSSQRDLEEQRQVYDSLLFHALLACWAKSYCNEFINLMYVPASKNSEQELLAWMLIYLERGILNVKMQKTISILRSTMTPLEIDIAEYKAANYLFYIEQDEFDYLGFISDYYAYQASN
jgi:hypothetical protein